MYLKLWLGYSEMLLIKTYAEVNWKILDFQLLMLFLKLSWLITFYTQEVAQNCRILRHAAITSLHHLSFDGFSVRLLLSSRLHCNSIYCYSVVNFESIQLQQIYIIMIYILLKLALFSYTNTLFRKYFCFLFCFSFLD